MYGLPSSAAMSIRQRQSSRTSWSARPSAVTHPCSAITLTPEERAIVLADDPGAGKTIMAGLFMKELVARGDLQRCLVVCPGSLAEQWQDELYRRFHLPFGILTNDKLEASRTGNWAFTIGLWWTE